MSRTINPAIHVAMAGFVGIAEAIGQDRQPTSDETATALGSVAGLVSLTVDAMIRAADALERMAEAAERVAGCESQGRFDVRTIADG